MYVTLAFKPFSILYSVAENYKKDDGTQDPEGGDVWQDVKECITPHSLDSCVCIIFKLALLSASFTCYSNM